MACEKCKSCKAWILITISAVLVIALAVGAFFLFGNPSNEPEDKNDSKDKNGQSESVEPEAEIPKYLLYVKGNQLWYSDMSDAEHIQITENLFNSNVVDDTVLKYFGLSTLCHVSNDKSYIIYPDKIDYDYDQFENRFENIDISLYYKSLTDPEAEAYKISSNIQGCYYVDDAFKTITYTTYYSDEGNYLYQYNVEEHTKEQIDSNVKRLFVNKDGSRIVYMTAERAVCIKDSGKEKETIDNACGNIEYITDDFSAIYYTKNDCLYKHSFGSETIKLFSDLSYSPKIYETGEIYYNVGKDIEIPYSDILNDDMAESDSQITKPVHPQIPYSEDYNSQEEYEAAYAEYERLKNEYLEDYAAYQAKCNRDSIRTSVNNRSFTVGVVDTYYFNGKESFLLDENNRMINTYTLSDSPIIYLYNSKLGALPKIKMSEIDSFDDIEAVAHDYRSDDSYTRDRVAIKGTIYTLGEKTSEINFSEDGKTIYIIISEGKQSKLYKAYTADGSIQTAELVDIDVQVGEHPYFLDNGELVYFKDLSYETNLHLVDMYINGVAIEHDVWRDKMRFYNNLITFATDYSFDDNTFTLKYLKDGKASVISEDVSDYTLFKNGIVAYMCDYDTTFNKGTFYCFNDGKAEKVSDDVQLFIAPTNINYYPEYFN